MAVITTGGSGNWSSTTNNAPWPGGTLPTNADVFVVASGHTVTLDVTTAVAQGGVVNSGGVLTCSTSASSKLTLERDLVVDGTCTLDVSSDVTKICDIVTNNANSAGTGTLSAAGAAAPANNLGGAVFVRQTGIITWKGATRKRWTTLASNISAGATSATVTDATGWQVGDVIIFSTTNAYNATAQTDSITLATVNTGTGAITWSGGTTYAHTTSGYVGNFSSNLRIGPKTAGWSGNVTFYNASASTAAKTINHVAFNYLATNSYSGSISTNAPFVIFGGDTTDSGWTSFDSNAFYDPRGSGLVCLRLNATVNAPSRTNNIYYAPNFQTTQDYTTNGVIYGTFLSGGCVMGTDTDTVIFRTPGPAIGGDVTSASYVRPKISGCETGFFALRSYGTTTITDPDIQSCNNVFRPYFGTIVVTSSNGTATKLGTNIANTNVFKLGSYGGSVTTLTDANVQSGGTFISNGSAVPTDANLITLVNKNADVTLQEIYHFYGTVKRNNSTIKRSTSSIAIAPTTAGVNTQYTVSIACASGATIRVIGYCQVDNTFYNSGTWTAPTAVLSGLGATPVTYTATSAASGAWQAIDLSITNSSGADGNFTLTFTANKLGAGNTGNVYFDGIPTNSPFVTKARNYGFLFDQTIPNVTTNITISALEATALTYAGSFTITGGTSTSSTAIIGSTTFQKLYDYTQAWSCTTANLAYAIPVTGAGLAGSPVLFAQGNVTISTTKVLNGSGSINMGSYTLTTETASAQAYTYTGGAWSQATTVPSVSGGTLALSGEGTWTLTALGSPIITFAPTANAVTYAMGGSTFGGTVDLRNTSATRTITVELPSGTTYTTANNTGAAITVSTPQVYQSVTVSGATAGSRIQIYDTTSSTELYNGTPAFPYTWTDPTPASATRAIRLRVAYQSGVTANNFIDVNIGTCATSGAGKDISYLVDQTPDYTYNLNAIDGSTVTGITITAGPNRVSMNFGGGTVTNASIYAYQVYWQATATGIANESAFISSSDPANYIYTDFLWKNTNLSVPLTITGGWARDSVTGLTETLFDTTGYAIFAAANASLLVTTGSGPLTAGQEAELATAASSSATAATAATDAANNTANLTYSGTAVQVDVQKVLGTVIQTGSTSTASIGY